MANGAGMALSGFGTGTAEASMRPKHAARTRDFVLAADNEFLCDQISPCGHLVRRRMWYIGEFHIEAWNIALLNFIDNRFALA